MTTFANTQMGHIPGDHGYTVHIPQVVFTPRQIIMLHLKDAFAQFYPFPQCLGLSLLRPQQPVMWTSTPWHRPTALPLLRTPLSTPPPLASPESPTALRQSDLKPDSTEPHFVVHKAGVILQCMGQGNWTATCKRMEVDLHLIPLTEINSEQIKDLKL